jgi:hypothetical protein
MDDSTTRHKKLIKQAGLLALAYGVNHKSPDGGSLGTRLLLISDALDIANPDAPINDEVPELNKVIARLKSILQVWATSRAAGHFRFSLTDV